MQVQMPQVCTLLLQLQLPSRMLWHAVQVHPRATKPAREGPEVGWTSGIVGPDAEDPGDRQDPADKKIRKYHVITTAQGAAVHWQTRIHYYWWV